MSTDRICYLAAVGDNEIRTEKITACVAPAANLISKGVSAVINGSAATCTLDNRWLGGSSVKFLWKRKPKCSLNRNPKSQPSSPWRPIGPAKVHCLTNRHCQNLSPLEWFNLMSTKHALAVDTLMRVWCMVVEHKLCGSRAGSLKLIYIVTD